MSSGACSPRAKVAIIGAGNVGSTIAFSLMVNGICSEIALIDKNGLRAEGEALDLRHCMQFTNMMTIVAGDSYELVAGADVIVIAAGFAQKPGESRTDLLQKNSEVMAEVIPSIMKFNKTSIILMVTNPLDVMTYIAWKLSGLSACTVLGTGTVLDSARLRFLIGEHFKVSPKDVTAYILGEHGDTSFAWWSNATIGGIFLNRFSAFDHQVLQQMYEKVRLAAGQIIAKKGATFYAIALSVVKIIRAILLDQPRVFSLSHVVTKIYGCDEICLSLPTIIRKSGVCEMLQIQLDQSEEIMLQRSVEKIKEDIQTALKYVKK